MAEQIVLKDVCFHYGRKKVLNQLSFSVECGEKVCLFGPSGCGKSTVLRLICGLEKPTSGEMICNTQSIRPVFQEDRLLPFLSVSENVAMFSDGEDPTEILTELGLAEVLNEPPKKLSGGMARRAALARALAGNGDIYVLDEPFNGLDEENTRRAIELIRRRTEGKTVVCVLHDRTHAEQLGCRMIDF